MNIGYKKLQNGYIAKLEILGKTNENRKNIANPQYAKYRTSKVKVLKIFHMNGEVNNAEPQMNDETQIIEQMNGLYDKNFVYIVGKEMLSDYDEDVNVMCSQGIHYFKTLEQAKMWNLYSSPPSPLYTGKYIEWWDNGNKFYEKEFKDGRIEGKWIVWYEGGTTRCEGEYKNGKEEGKHTEWYENGNTKEKGEYKDGKKEGKWIRWWESGTLQYEGEYKDGKEIFVK